MTSTPQVVVHQSKEEMAEATAARLVATIVEAQNARGVAHVVLTGGRNGNAVLASLGAAAGRTAIDWSRLDLWWGDERHLPAGDPERNETQARHALMGRVPASPGRIHPMPASDDPRGHDVDAAAAVYAAELASAAPERSMVPPFDVTLLGVGPDTHVASLFPESSGVRESERTVVAVRGAPKPPPTRVSLTLPAIRASREVWLLAAGEDKASAVALALSGAEAEADKVPAAGAYGTSRTLWLLDRAAAAELPSELTPPLSS